MTGTYSTEPTTRIRQFTVFAWLLWALIPALALGGLSWVTDCAEKSAGNVNPASLTAATAAAFYMTLLLVPIVTTLQWLILRRTRPKLVWPLWLLVVIVAVLASVVAGPIVMMETGSPLYGALPPILTIGLVAAAVLSIASPKPLRRCAFAIIFLSFLGGGALMYGIDTPQISSFLLEKLFPFNSFTAQASFLARASSAYTPWYFTIVICFHSPAAPP